MHLLRLHVPLLLKVRSERALLSDGALQMNGGKAKVSVLAMRLDQKQPPPLMQATAASVSHNRRLLQDRACRAHV